MSFIRKHSRTGLVAVVCLALGAGASAIATAGAATSHHRRAGAATRHRSAGARSDLRGRLLRVARRSVEGQMVVATKSGFVTVRWRRGTVDSVSGQQLTLTEGTKSKAYKQVTLTIPTSAKVRDNRKAASLSALTRGQRVVVLQAPRRAFVIAHTPRSG